MSIVVCKYLHNYGWVGVKNDDKNYKPNTKIFKSQRDGVERLMVWDVFSKYTEGLNEYGVSIISCPKNNGEEYREIKNKLKTEKRYYSPSGFVIRKSLLNKNCFDAAKDIIQHGVEGKTIVFDSENCLLIEMDLSEEKKYTIKEIPKYETGIIFSNYDYEDQDFIENYKSSIERKNACSRSLMYVTSPEELLDVCSTDSDNREFSPILKKSDKSSLSEYKTTSQILIVPKTKTLHVRPLYGKTTYDMEMLNNRDSKTFFELVSTRKLITLMNR